MGLNKVLATKSPEFQDSIRTSPLLPGCYLYKDGRGKVLYVGKAKIIRNRVKSYFSNYPRLEERIRQMIDKAKNVSFVITDSEIEALILENILIKKYKPKYNSMYVDDKSYVYVKFDQIRATKEGEYVQMPTISVTREQTDPGSKYFGPYPDSRSVRRLIRRLRRIYPFCTSKIKVSIPRDPNGKITPKNPKACFHYQINQCPGVCFGEISKKDYKYNLDKIMQFFRGEKPQLTLQIEKQMKKAAKRYDFEEAIRLRRMLYDIKYVGSNLHIGSDIDEVAISQAKREKRAKAASDLIAYLDFPKDKLSYHNKFRIEAYDISNFQGSKAVGSMVVSINGKPSPSNYRRFRIRMKNEPNDFAMMQEVLTRRFAQYLKAHNNNFQTQKVSIQEEYTDNEGFTISIPKNLIRRIKNWKPDPSFSQLPDLIIIDGGKGQLSSAYKILSNFGLQDKIPVVGLAKKEEEIFKIPAQFTKQLISIESETQFGKIKLPRRSEALYLVQRIRDEAHRFAITYHKYLRNKSLLPNA